MPENRIKRYADIMLRNKGLAEAVGRGDFSPEDVRKAARLVQKVRANILVPGGPRRVVGQAEVYLHAAAKLRPEVRSGHTLSKPEVLLDNLATDTDPKRIFFRRGSY